MAIWFSGCTTKCIKWSGGAPSEKFSSGRIHLYYWFLFFVPLLCLFPSTLGTAFNMDAGCYLLFNSMQAVVYCLIRFLFQKEESEVRFCAMRWATLLFDMQHCPSRFICMVGAADTKLDIRLAYDVCWLTLSGDSCLANSNCSISFYNIHLWPY